MTEARFLQIHTLHGYPAVLLNRDDAGLAKRMRYGGALRTRVSSQCLKRAWRTAQGPDALTAVDGGKAAVRSRETVTRRVVEPLRAPFLGYDPEAVKRIGAEFQKAVYGEKKGDETRQPLLLGEPEIEWLAQEAAAIAAEHGKDAEAAGQAAAEWRAVAKDNMRAMRRACSLAGGVAGALFGRMVTSDPEANIDAAVHVAHAFTVHEEQAETDYFTVVDDLRRDKDDAGADHVGETEVTSGLFYGYVVVDRGTLIRNLGGDAKMAGALAGRLAKLVATVSPGAKRGSTAPYDYASWMLVEAGSSQPRSLAEAFRTPCPASPAAEAERRAGERLARVREAYGDEAALRVMSVENPGGHEGVPVFEARYCRSINEITAFAAAAVESGEAA